MAHPPSSQPILSPQAPPPVGGELSQSHKLKNSEWHQLLVIEVMMCAAIIMASMMLLGSLRKRTRNAFFKLCLWATVVLTPMFISYIVGLMTNLKNGLFIVWGLLLLIRMASYGTISAFELEDNETALAAFVQWSLKCAFVFFMIIDNNMNQIPKHLRWALVFLGPLVMFKLIDRVAALAYASKNNVTCGVGSVVRVVAEFMAWDVRKTLQGEEQEVADPKSMNGYRYLVGIKYLESKSYDCLPPSYHRDFDMSKEDIITTQEIWKCEGDLLCSRGGDIGGRLKDTCLSFALFLMLLRRYAGYPLAEVNSLEGKTWNFVRYGLTPDTSPATCERAFRVIEEELSFLYDFFYTKNYLTYLKGTRTMVKEFLLMVAFLVIAQFILNSHRKTHSVKIVDYLPPVKLDVLITRVVIYVMLLFELVFLVHHLFITQWSTVEWVCTYVRKELWRSQTRKDKCLRWAIEYICRHSLRRSFKHWKREIDQYSLILSHDYISPLNYFTWVFPMDLANVQEKYRKASEPITLCIDLKTAILSSLHANGGKLTNGKFSLQKYGVENDFSWACSHETHTQFILVWHIATSFCELNQLNQYPADSKSNHLFVATGLSQYCAYLVAFAPELLPDQINTTSHILKYVIKEANNMFKGCPNMESKYETMRAMTGEYNDAEDSILKKGIWLGKSLVDRMSADSLWQMLGEFWAELLLYLAPTDDVTSHVKHLANGGELITHIWTLLTHAGILKRD